MNEKEIMRDIPLIGEKLMRCEKTILDLSISIMKEQQSIVEIQMYINEDEGRVKIGKKPRFDTGAMRDNIERHKKNMILFEDTIEKEKLSIEKFKDILSILQADLERKPEHITIGGI